MCASATIDLLIAFYVDGRGGNLSHVTFIITIFGPLVGGIIKTTRTYGNHLLLILELAAIFLGCLIAHWLLDGELNTSRQAS